MRQLEKIIVNDTQYMIWNATAGTRPTSAAIALLLDGESGVGAQALLIVDTCHEAIRSFDATGREISLDAAALYAAALWLAREGQAARSMSLLNTLPAEVRASLEAQTPYHIEVRLTDAFDQRLTRSAGLASIAG